jgi:single-strand DNA-binding protein
MGSVNKAIIIGNAGKDPETKYTDAGVAVCTLTLATKHSWKEKDGQRQEKTEWHRVVFWAKLAEIVDKYVKKGSQVYVEGRIETRKWTDKNGNDKYTTEIVADQMQMLSGRPKAEVDNDEEVPF